MASARARRTPPRADALQERVKELQCLYRISALGQRTDLTLDDVVQRAVEVLPPAWQYPEVTAARIVLEGREVATAGFEGAVANQSQPILVDGQQMGVVEVCYTAPRPAAAEGPFLAEERQLIVAVAAALGDLARRARARAAIDATNAKNRALLAALPDLIFQIDRTGILLGFHPGSYAELEPILGELVGRDLVTGVDDEWIPRRVRERLLMYVERAFASGAPQVFEQSVSWGRSAREFEVRLVVSTEGVVLGMLRDITDQRRLEKEILEISGREQRRIGRELHDGLCQHLAGVGFLAKALATRSPPDLAPGALEIVNLIDEAITLTKGLARGLNPIRLDAEGLVAALRELAEHTQRIFGVPCAVAQTGAPPELDAAVALHLYRLAQEAVGNAIRHAEPRSIRIELQIEPPHGTLTIADDGLGFSATEDRGAGMGLSIMRYRAWIIGGALELGAAAPHGTRVVCRFPLN